ncbi:dipeptidase [Aureibacillus halotolerans]|uniref:Membrane dipeptidase n=1 Tax=Aureibacillus halotolerans TaxID=1508390 RepID=A0A4V3D5E2_9BACI|nr:membrane dipeptidase [Aureibacillus halotolerans]TDQ39717.1 membrane dipeptidase [Aureibacillus halotolerans]
MGFYDFHCDVLYKLWMNPTLSFANSEALDIHLGRLTRQGAEVQTFALFVAEEVADIQQFDVVLEMINLYNEQVLAQPQIKPILTKADVENLTPPNIGAFLTLEGCDAIGKSLDRLKILLHLGVRSVGLTWNDANAVADGVGEPRGAGLSLFGKDVVRTLNEHNCWTDVSHLSIAGFWDVIDLADVVWASHSNARAIADHPRNLNDDQIKALFARKGLMGVTFVPDFIRVDQPARAEDLLTHIDHLLALGGEDFVIIGSDFDGIDEKTIGLETYDSMQSFKDLLASRYDKEIVDKLTRENARRFMLEHLPS